MSNTSKTIIWIIVVIIVILGLYLIFFPSGSMTPSEYYSSTEPVSTVSATDTSDQALNQDMTNVDAQSGALNSDNTNVDAGINQSSY